ncbi:hypothetical protein [Stenotrophomonas sp. NPDC077659]|uniref:hypothetical protein n=1 Tax=Stenotrophomonas sp. NPDC077659 TaxID=3390694 RepID=UPI003CFD64E1
MTIEPPPPLRSALPEVAASHAVMPLRQRMQEQAPAASESDPVPLPEPGEDPVPLPVPVEDPARVWAQRIFMETIFYGEEEENGIPPLTIEL